MNESIILIFAVSLAVGIVVLSLIFNFYLYKKRQFVCIRCSASYQATSFPQFLFGFFPQSLFGLSDGTQRKLKCPNCNKREWANVQKVC